jgi:hypothetical protein
MKKPQASTDTAHGPRRVAVQLAHERYTPVAVHVVRNGLQMTRCKILSGTLSRCGHVTGVLRLRLVSMVASESKRLPAAFFSGPR